MNDKPQTTDRAVPDYAHVVVVPIANPATAPELLKLAQAFVKHEGGRVIALAVVMGDGDAEGNRQRLDELESIVETFKPKPKNIAVPLPQEGTAEAETESVPEPIPEDKTPPIEVEFVTRVANNIARGILDQARESGAELVILGVQKPSRGSVQLGVVTQSVMSAAPCDVLVYRHAERDKFTRVVVPVDGTPASRMAVRIGILFGNSFDSCPVEAMYVQGSEKPEFIGRTHIAQALEGVPGRGTVKQTLVTAQSVSDGILSRVEKDHLIVMGFSHRNEFSRWLEGESPSRHVLDRAPGPVLLAVRATDVVSMRQRLSRRFMGWIRPTLTDVEQEQIVWTASSNAGTTLDYVVLMIVASTLASLGLLANSATVIIGAMLVAPLMSPLNAFGVGLATARIDIMRRSILTAVVGISIASFMGIIVGLLVPLQTPTPEMMARVNPSLLDAFVALASGMVGSYATARKDIPSALAGVAIAAALVPPICTFGLQLAFGNQLWAAGAMLLFLTNMVFIVFIATGMFAWLGLRPRGLNRASRRWYASIIIFVLLSVPTVVWMLNVSQRAGRESIVEDSLREVLPQVEIVSITFPERDPLVVDVELRSSNDISAEAVQTAQTILAQRLGLSNEDKEEIRLQIVLQRIILAPREDVTVEATAESDAPLVVTNDVIVPNEDVQIPTSTPNPESQVTPTASD